MLIPKNFLEKIEAAERAEKILSNHGLGEKRKAPQPARYFNESLTKVYDAVNREYDRNARINFLGKSVLQKAAGAIPIPGVKTIGGIALDIGSLNSQTENERKRKYTTEAVTKWFKATWWKNIDEIKKDISPKELTLQMSERFSKEFVNLGDNVAPATQTLVLQTLIPNMVETLANHDQTIRFTTDRIKTMRADFNLLDLEVGTVKLDVGTVKEALVTVDQGLSVMKDWMAADREARQNQTLLNNANQAFQLVGMLGQLTGSRTVSRMAGVGMAGVQVYQHYQALKGAVEGTKAIAAASSAATAATAGAGLASGAAGFLAVAGPVAGIAMAAISIMNLFGDDDGDDAMEVISQQLRMISEQIHVMRHEMHGRFDRIERQLDGIYQTMCDEFDRVIRTIHSDNAETRAFLKISFDDVIIHMQKLRADVRNCTREISFQNMQENLYKLGKIESGSQGFQTMSLEIYESYMDKLEFWLESRDKHPVFNGLNDSNERVHKILPFLGDSSNFGENHENLFHSLGYLSNYLQESMAFDVKPNLANPVLWILQAEQYIKLTANRLIFYPNETKRRSFPKIIQNGQDVLNFIASVRDSKSLFEQLFVKYEGSLAAVKELMNAIIKHENEQLNTKNNQAVKIDIFDAESVIKQKSDSFFGVAPLCFSDKLEFKYMDMDNKLLQEINGIILAERLGVGDIFTSGNSSAGGYYGEYTMTNHSRIFLYEKVSLIKHLYYRTGRTFDGIPYNQSTCSTTKAVDNLSQENDKALAAIQKKLEERKREVSAKLLDATIEPGRSFGDMLNAVEDSYLMIKAFLTLIGIELPRAHETLFIRKDKIIQSLKEVKNNSEELLVLKTLLESTLLQKSDFDKMKNDVIENLNDPAKIARVSLETALKGMVLDLQSLDRQHKTLGSASGSKPQATGYNTRGPGVSANNDSWATSSGIQYYLEEELGTTVHLMNSELGSVNSIFSDNKEEAEEAEALMCLYAEKIVGFTSGESINTNNYIHKDGGTLTKPIVIPLNLSSARPLNSRDVYASGGSHWLACVILPKEYVTPQGTEVKNKHEQIFLVDSLNQTRALPKNFQNILTKGKEEYKFSTEEGNEVTHRIPAAFPNAQFIEMPAEFKQQKGGSDCGWWAVANMIAIVKTGSANGLIDEAKKDPEHANHLRARYPFMDRLQPKIAKEQQDKPSPSMVTAYSKFKDKLFKLSALSQESEMQRFSFEITCPNVTDEKQRIQLKLASEDSIAMSEDEIRKHLGGLATTFDVYRKEKGLSATFMCNMRLKMLTIELPSVKEVAEILALLRKEIQTADWKEDKSTVSCSIQ